MKITKVKNGKFKWSLKGETGDGLYKVENTQLFINRKGNYPFTGTETIEMFDKVQEKLEKDGIVITK